MHKSLRYLQKLQREAHFRFLGILFDFFQNVLEIYLYRLAGFLGYSFGIMTTKICSREAQPVARFLVTQSEFLLNILK